MSTGPIEPVRAQGAASISGPQVDSMPADRAVLASLTPEQRAAIYLNQIRKMLIFFVVLAAVGIIAGLIIWIANAVPG